MHAGVDMKRYCSICSSVEVYVWRRDQQNTSMNKLHKCTMFRLLHTIV